MLNRWHDSSVQNINKCGHQFAKEEVLWCFLKEAKILFCFMISGLKSCLLAFKNQSISSKGLEIFASLKKEYTIDISVNSDERARPKRNTKIIRMSKKVRMRKVRKLLLYKLIHDSTNSTLGNENPEKKNTNLSSTLILPTVWEVILSCSFDRCFWLEISLTLTNASLMQKENS